MNHTFDDLLPHIRPLAPLLDDPDVTEIMVNEGGRVIFTQRGGRLHREPITLKPAALRTAIEVIARMVEQEPDGAHPLLNARLADGSRVSARHHDPGLTYLNVWPGFDAVRADPRFQDLVRRIGIPSS